ncbi:cysteine proteinase [Gigaspora margarita]|uniref:Cysteine proteinase n=1 Tax=Gigaspora margarita TaxID=4874 RepID=A0A8H4EGQ7_GIGMA|nr:cysteine proteinase [Gigaspora margarita]
MPPSIVMDYETIANRIMPNFGLEIKDFQYHTWNVTNWSKLPGRLTGPAFEVGGWKWQILLYPFGNHNLNKISIYLKFVDQQGESTGWHACAQFVLLLWNSEEPMQYISSHGYSRFDAECSNWGFGNFYDQDKLFIPFNNRTRPLIDNDSCNITALVRILKDPTGKLWHTRNTYFTECIGLKSQRTNTFFNSVILSLYYIRYFREAIYITSKKSDKPARNIASALQKVFYQLNVSAPSIDTTELTRFFGWNTLSISDVRKFIRVLQDDLEDKMKNTKMDGTISKLFVGTMKTHIKCVNVDYESLHLEDYYDIQFNVKRCNTLDDSFTDYVQETLDGDNKHNAEGYGLQVAKKSVVFESFPPILHIHLDRSDYDAQNNLVKSNDRYEFPMEIDLQKYLSPDADKSKPYKYILHGVLVHVGQDQYFALLKPDKNGRWFKFCDSQITKVSIKKMLHNNGFVWFICGFKVVISTDEENEKKKEKGRLQILVMTEEMFKNHKGFNIINLYDRRFPLSEVSQIEMLKTDTFGTFKNVVSAKFKIPINQMRFWIIKKQDNINFRLHNRITDDLINTSMDEIRLTQYDGLRVYVEVYKKLIDIKKKPIKATSIIIFLKYFNPYTQSLEGLGHLYVQKDYTIDFLFPILCERKKLPSNTLLDIYKEVEPNIIKPNIFKKMNSSYTFKKYNIQNGDIICFQKTLTNKEIQDHVSANRIYNIPQFYESLSMNIVVHFKAKFGYKDLIPEFNLILNRILTYKSVVNQVAIHLNIDPLKLRLISVDSSGEPKYKINNMTDQALSKFLRFSNLLYYEIL